MRFTTLPRYRVVGPLAVALLCVVILGGPAGAQRNAPSKVLPVGEELDDSLGYGIDLETGLVALEVGKVFVFCTDPGILVAHPHHLDLARETLGATVRGDTWEIDGQSYQLQTAEAAYETGRSSASNESLKLVNADQFFKPTAVAKKGCFALWQGFKCNVGPFTCPDPWLCFNGFQFDDTKYWWRCSYTGNPFDFCTEWFQTVCTLNEFTCDDCTGPIISQTPIQVPACVVLP